MQISTSTFFRQQSENITDLKTQTAQLEERIATGKKVTKPSDDPVAFSAVSILKARQARLEQYDKTAQGLTQRLSTEDSVLTQVTNILTRVKELTVQASNDTYSTADRKAIAAEVTSLNSELVALANTKTGDGSYLFSGYLANQQPFSTTNGLTAYHGDTGRLSLTIADDTEMEVSSSGHEVFMAVKTGANSAKSVFEIVQTITNNLNAGQTPSASLTDLQSASDHINGYHAINGARLARVNSTSDTLTSDMLATKSRLSSLEDTDIEKAITELKQKMTSLEAAQSSFVRASELSLFNYLK
jgi:flagellar hook-associated protein 3 FlgL